MFEFIITALVVAVVSFFSYRAGKTKAVSDNREEMIDAITNARKARSKLSDPDYVEWLRRKRGK